MKPFSSDKRRKPSSTPRAAVRAERRKLALGAATLVLCAIAAVISTIAINGLPWSNPYEVRAFVPPESPIVRPGDEVRVAGQRVGEVREVLATERGREVRMELDQGEIGDGARATVRLRGLAGAVFIELEPGDLESPEPSGAIIPRSQTESGTPLTDVVAAFDATVREDLSRTVTVSGIGLAGRGEGLNRTIGSLPGTLDRGTPQLEALRPRPGALSGLLADTGTTMAALGAEPDGLAGLITGGREVFEATASENGALAATIEVTPEVLEEIHLTTPVAIPTLTRLETTVSALQPAAEDLERALPSLESLLSRDEGLVAAARIGEAARPVLELARPVLAELDPAIRTLEPLVRAAEPLAAYVARYPEDVFAGPNGFTTWGKFNYSEGQASGSKAVRFTPILTCAPGRNPYPEPGKAGEDRQSCG